MTIHSINDLLKLISDFNQNRLFYSWFRGQADNTWSLLPSVKRSPYNKPKHEQYMATNFYTEASQRMKDPPKDKAGWICLMQHYGLPTRLLDWSESPLVALYFAVSEPTYDHVDAALWLLDPIGLNLSQGYGDYLPPMDYHTVLARIEPAFKDKLKSADEVLACRSVENDLRMYVQQAAFTVHGSDHPLEKMTQSSVITKLEIPSQDKEKLRWQLKILGFKSSTIFPDIEHVAAKIKEDFS